MKKLVAQEPLREERDPETKALTILVGGLKFETFPSLEPETVPHESHTSEWRWRARSGRNKQIVATCGEAFVKRGNAERAMRAFVQSVRG